MQRYKELTPSQIITSAALIVLVTLIITLLSLVLVPGEFGARLYAFANVAVFVAGVWLASRDIRRHGRD